MYPVQPAPGAKSSFTPVLVPNQPLLQGEIADNVLIAPVPEVAAYVAPAPSASTSDAAAAPAPISVSAPSPSPDPGAIDLMVPSDTDCALSAKNSQYWAQLNNVYLDYPQGIGNLANVASIPTPNPSPLSSALAGIPGINATAVQDASTLGVAIFNFFEGANVDRDLRKYVQSVDKPYTSASNVLLFVDQTYANKLRDEFGQIDGHYVLILRNELAVRGQLKLNDPQRLVLDNILQTQQAQRASDLTAINAFASASVDYAAVVSKLAALHHDLYEASLKKAGFSDYNTLISQSLLPLYGDIEALKKDTK